jgi:hypothetical protein
VEGLQRVKQGYNNRKQNRNQQLQDNTPRQGPPIVLNPSHGVERIHYLSPVSFLATPTNPLHGVGKKLAERVKEGLEATKQRVV